MSTNSLSAGDESFKGWNLIKKVKPNSGGNSNSDDDGSVVIIEREVLDLSNESSDESDVSNVSSVSVKRDSPNGFVNNKHDSPIQHNQNHIYETGLQLEDYFRIVLFTATVILGFSLLFSFTAISDEYSDEIIFPSGLGTRKYDVIEIMKETGIRVTLYLDLLNEITDVIFHAILINRNTYLLNIREVKNKEKLVPRHPDLFSKSIRNQLNVEIDDDIWWIDKANLRTILRSHCRFVHLYATELLQLNRIILNNIDSDEFDKYFSTRFDVKSANFSKSNNNSNGSLDTISESATANSGNSSWKRNTVADFLTVKKDDKLTDSERANTSSEQFDYLQNSDVVDGTSANSKTGQNEYNSTENNDRSDASAEAPVYSQNIIQRKANINFEVAEEDNSMVRYRSDGSAERRVHDNPLISRTEYYHPKKLTDMREAGDKIKSEIKNNERKVKYFECDSGKDCVRKFYKHDKKNSSSNDNDDKNNNDKLKLNSKDNCKKLPPSRPCITEKNSFDFDEAGNSERKVSFRYVDNDKGAEQIDEMGNLGGKERLKYANYNKQFAADRLPPKQSPQSPLPEDSASTDDGNRRFWKLTPDELIRSFRKTNENVFSSFWNRNNKVKVQKVLKKVQKKVDRAIDKLQKQYRKLLWMLP